MYAAQVDGGMHCVWEGLSTLERCPFSLGCTRFVGTAWVASISIS